jgi:hypothetical protein
MRIVIEVPADPFLLQSLLSDDGGEPRPLIEGVEVSRIGPRPVERRTMSETMQLASLALTFIGMGVDVWELARALSSRFRERQIPNVKIDGVWTETTPEGLRRQLDLRVEMQGRGSVKVDSTKHGLHVKLVEDPPDQ